MLYVIIALVFIILLLIFYNMSIHKKIQNFQNMHQKVTSLNVLQDFMNIVGNDMDVNNKIKAINDIIIDKYEIKYSTIVIFDGTDYIIKASNVDEKHWETLRNLHEVDIFKDSIMTAAAKYVTINNENEKLPYQQMEFGRAKSAIFFPLYIDNVYIGFWIIESGVPHDFDNIDTTIFDTVKENIVTVLKTINYQKTLESIVREDLYSELYTAEYLYGAGKKIIDENTTSAVCMFKIDNIQDINNISRSLGNKTITTVCRHIKESISKSYIFVRYNGPKFVIVFTGLGVDNIMDFVNDIKENTEQLDISLDENFEVKEIEDKDKKKKTKRKKKSAVVKPALKFVISTYYKGTGIEEVLKKMETYVDDNSKTSSINNI